MVKNTVPKIYARLYCDIKRLKQPGQPFITGVTGTDCAGKTLFAGEFEHFLREQDEAVQVIHLDDFHQLRAVRHSDDYDDAHYYQRVKDGRVFDFNRLEDTLLRPIRERGYLETTLDVLDLTTDQRDVRRDYRVTPASIVIIEGVFLFLEVFRPYLDYVIYLSISTGESLARARRRDTVETVARYERRYLPAAEAHLTEFPPVTHADIIIDNTDWTAPRITSERVL